MSTGSRVQNFSSFDILTEIKDNWWFLLKVLGNLYIKPFQPNYITNSWANILSSPDVALTSYTYDVAIVREFITHERTKEFQTKTHYVKKFDYKIFNEYFKVSPGLFLQNLRSKLVGYENPKAGGFQIERIQGGLPG